MAISCINKVKLPKARRRKSGCRALRGHNPSFEGRTLHQRQTKVQTKVLRGFGCFVIQTGHRNASPSDGSRLVWVSSFELVNDPSAGSPTETLLRLLLPLNDKV